jgi:glycosyltransferase involved in cell wall biosynthesis
MVTADDEDAQSVRDELGLNGGPILGSFGFLRPYKGVLELIRALPAIRDAFPNVKLLALNSKYPTSDSLAYEQQCFNEIKHLGLDSCILLNTEYFQIFDVLHLLHAVDLTVLPYHDSRESASGAANVCLAARRPLLISRSSIFSDVAGFCAVLPSLDPGQIAQAVIHILNNEELLRKLNARVRAANDSRNWDAVARRLIDSLKFSATV